MVFIPTYLYIKQHTKTGKLYFGKCSRDLESMLKYKGSGIAWKSHISKYGVHLVATLWYQLYDNPFDLVADALSMSKSFDIVSSGSWMNLSIENGLDGSISGIKLSDSHKAKIGISNSIASKRESTRNKRILGNMNRVLSPQAILNMRNAQLGKVVSDETKRKISSKSSEWNNRPEILEMHRKNSSGRIQIVNLISKRRVNCKESELGKYLIYPCWIKQSFQKPILDFIDYYNSY